MSSEYTFNTLFLEQLNDLYSAEQQVIAILPLIISAVSSGDFREQLELYQQTLFEHIDTLEKGFETIKEAFNGITCPAVEGMVVEADQILHHGGNSAVKDAAFIAILQRMQHFKIAVYGTARTYARHLEYNRLMDFCQRALHEEIEADKHLTRLAEGGVFTTGINEEAYREIN